MKEPVSPVSWIMPTLLHAALALGLCGRLVLAGPVYDHTFKNFNMALPEMTLWSLSVSHWFANYWYVLVMPFLAAVALEGVLLYWLGGWSRRAGLVWTVLIALAILFLWGGIEVSWYLPLDQLRRGLEKS